VTGSITSAKERSAYCNYDGGTHQLADDPPPSLYRQGATKRSGLMAEGDKLPDAAFGKVPGC